MALLRLCAAALVFFFAVASTAHALRIATYNILNYNSGREADFRTVLADIDPDVIVVQEILSQTGVNNFRDNVLNFIHPGQWSSAAYVNGPDTDNAMFYKTALIDVDSHFIISTTLRDIDEWTIRPAGSTSPDAAIRIYTLHLKASQGGTNEQRRLDEVTAMRARMETFAVGANYLIAGDFNIYRDTEPAYQYMINPVNGLAGVVEDPINREGNWHNNAAFADVHTQSPRTTQFGGGANGGMDDRFDMILVGPSLVNGEGFDILDATYEAFGQDGQHFNGALTDPPFIVVDMAMAEAIHDASDHLPVFADFDLFADALIAASLDVQPAIVGGVASELLMVGNEAVAPADELDYSFAAPAGFTAPAGTFEVDAGAPDNAHSIELSTATAGNFGGTLVVTTDDPEEPTVNVALTGTVLDHAEPSVSDVVAGTLGSLSFGSVASGDSAFASAVAYNFDYDALQALLEVHSATLVGDPRFFFDGSFSPQTIGAGAANIALGFDALGALDGLYTATLVLETRDQQDLSGAIDLADLQYDLTAIVGAPVDAGAFVAQVEPGIRGTSPNPFVDSARLEFGVAANAAHVSLVIYDVGGRQVATLVDSPLDAGWHQVSWNGHQSDGRRASPGIYFARFVSGGVIDVEKITRLR